MIWRELCSERIRVESVPRQPRRRLAMHRALRLLVTLLSRGLFAPQTEAVPIPLGGGITVNCQMSDGSQCIQIGTQPLTWGISEGTAPGEPTVQPGIALFFNVPFATQGAIDILDPDGSKSDQVSFLNFAANNGNGVLDFF